MMLEKVSKGRYIAYSGRYEIIRAEKWDVYCGEQFVGKFRTLEDAMVAIERREER